MRLTKFRLNMMAEDGSGGGGGDASGGDGGGDAGGDAGGEGSSQSSLGSANAGDDFSATVPEKYRAFSGEGDNKKFDVQASFENTLRGYAHLSEKMGAGAEGLDLAPKTAEDYKLDGAKFGEKFDLEAHMSNDLTKEFMTGAHEAGLNNAQVQFVMEHALNKMIPSISEAKNQISFEASESALLERYKTSEGVSAAKASAMRAIRGITGNDEEAIEKLQTKYGNDPDFVAFAASIGKEMREDDPVILDNILGGDDIESLLSSDAYLDPKHKDNKRTAKRVREFYQAKYSNKAVA